MNNNGAKNKLTEVQLEQLRSILSETVPEDKIRKVLMTIQDYNDQLDLGDSPYNRMTFPRLILLIVLICSLVYFIAYPVYNMVFSEENPEEIKKQLIEKRKQPSNSNFGIIVRLEKLPTWQEKIKVYDYYWQKVLGVWDFNWWEWLVLASNLDWKEIATSQYEVIKTSNVDLAEDIKQEIAEIKKDNYSIESTYKDYQTIDFGVDQLINKQQ